MVCALSGLYISFPFSRRHQSNSSSASSEIIIPQHPTLIPRFSPWSLLSDFTQPNWNPFSTQSLPCSSSVSLLPYPFKLMTQVLVVTNHLPNQVNQFIVIQCINIIYLIWVKHFTQKKVKFSRATFLSKLEITANSKSVFNTKCPEFSKKW